MKKLTKKLLIGVLSLAFVVGTSVGAINIGTAAYTATADAAQSASAQNLALSADNWTNASAFTSKTDGLYANSNSVYAITKTQFGADNTLETEIAGSLSDAGWCYSWLVLKQSEPNAKFDPSSKTISGNAVVFLYGASAGNGTLFEFVDGELKTTKELYFNGNNSWYAYKVTTKISATIKDTETGYDLSITLAAGEQAAETRTHSSTTAELKGNGYAQFGYHGGGTVSDTSNYVLTKFEVTGDMVTLVDNTLNMATSLDYAKDVLAGNAFSYVEEEGLVLEGATKAGELMYKPVASGQKVTLQWNNTLTGAQWGNCYIVIKNMTGKYVEVPSPYEIETYNSTPDANDNWIAVLFGTDGLKLYVCVGGQIEMTDLGNGADNNDVWFWYKQATTATITATDVAETDDDDAHILIEFTLVGTSGKLTTKTYSIYEDIDAFYGKDGLFEYHYLLSTGGNLAGNKDYICLQKLQYSGVESLTLPDVDITEINNTLASYTVIDATNYETAKAYYESIETTKATFNYTLNKNFNADAFTALGNALETWETEVENAEAVVTKINTLPTEITADNYQSAKSLITSIESDYAALSANGKALVTGYDKVATVKAAIEAYEATLGGNSSDNGNSSGNDNGSKGGCGSAIISSSVMAAFGLTALGGVMLLKKKKD